LSPFIFFNTQQELAQTCDGLGYQTFFDRAAVILANMNSVLRQAVLFGVGQRSLLLFSNAASSSRPLQILI